MIQTKKKRMEESQIIKKFKEMEWNFHQLRKQLVKSD